MNKKAQITFFVILGIIILIIIGSFLLIRNISEENRIEAELKKKNSFNLKATSVKEYVGSCVEESLIKSIEINGIYATDSISSYLNQDLEKCDFSSFENQGLSITRGSIDSVVTKGPDKIIATVNYQIEVSQDIYSQRFERFFSEYKLSKTQNIITDNQGRVLNSQTINSPNYAVKLLIPKDTTIKDSSGDNVNSISVEIKDSFSDDEVVTGIIYKLSPQGTIFNRLIRLVLQYDEAIIEFDGDEDKLIVLYRYNASDPWLNLPTTINKESNTLTSYIYSFSEVAIGLESPIKKECDFEICDYLVSGEQTLITQKIWGLSKKEIGGNNKMDYLINILHWLHGYTQEGPQIDDNSKIMKRTVHEIIFEGLNRNECSDHALVFVTFARAKGIPAKYIQTVSQDWLDEQIPKGWDGSARGHVFVEAYINNRWYVVNPQKNSFHKKTVEQIIEKFIQTNQTIYPYRKIIDGKEYIIEESQSGFERYSIFKEGYDAWDLGLRSIDEFKEEIRKLYFS